MIGNNNLTVTFVTRGFSKKQGKCNINRKLHCVDKRTNDILVKILQITNNPRLFWQFKTDDSSKWENQIIELNQSLIDNGIIVPTEIKQKEEKHG